MDKRQDYSEYINKKFGKLTILSIIYPNNIIGKRAYANCLCECGREKEINLRDIIKNKIKTCGCSKRLHISLVGRKLGSLNILSRINDQNYPSHKGVYYMCQCDCGIEKIIGHSAIERQNQRSCGCKSTDDRRKKTHKLNPAWKGVGDISGHHYASIKHNAKRRNLEFSLTKEYIWDLYEAQNKRCALSDLDIYFTNSYSNGVYTASLDRIDSNKGYIIGNVQWVHKDINYMKSNHSQEYFLSLCEKIYNKNKK